MKEKFMNDKKPDYSGQDKRATDFSNPFLERLFGGSFLDEQKLLLVDTIQTSSNNNEIAQAYLNLGDILYNENRYDRAKACYEQGLLLDPIDATLRAKLSYGKANTCMMEGDYTAAEKSYHQSLEVFREIHFVPGLAETLIQLSDVARMLGKHRESETFGRESLEVNVRAHRFKGTIRATRSLCNLAVQYEALGEVGRARGLIEFCLQALQLGAINSDAIRIVEETLTLLSNSGDTILP